MDESKQRIADALARDDREAALHALRWAAAWAAHTLRERGPRRDDEGAGALREVALLDDALTEIAEVAGLLPDVLAEADAGPGVEHHLRERATELSTLREATARLVTLHDELATREGEVRAALDRNAELTERVTELRRAERLARALDGLAAQRAALDARLAAVSGPTGEAQDAILASGGELLLLTESRRAALAPRVRRALEDASAADAALREEAEALARAEAEVTRAAEHRRELHVLREERLAILQAHARSDRHLLSALLASPPAGTPTGSPDAPGGTAASAPALLRDLLDEVDQRLTHLDTALASTLAAAPSRTPLPWAPAPP